MTAVQIIERDGEPRVSSEAIAGGSGVQHASTLRLIDDNLNDLQEFGQVRFEIRPGYNNSSVRFALLNEQQATLVMTYQRNTDQVREFKKALVRAFFENMQRSVIAAPALTEDEIVHQALAITARRVEVLEARVTELEPVAAHAETFRQADGLRTVGDVANDFKAHCAANFPKVKVRHRDVWDHAGRLGIVIRTDSVRHNQPTAQAIEAGWARPHRSTFDTNTRGEQTAVSTRLTPRGEARLWDGLAAWLGAHGTLDGARFRRSEVAS